MLWIHTCNNMNESHRHDVGVTKSDRKECKLHNFISVKLKRRLGHSVRVGIVVALWGVFDWEHTEGVFRGAGNGVSVSETG